LAPLGAAQLAVAESFLATQDLRRATLVVWVPAAPGAAPRALEPLARLFPGRVRFRALDLAAEAEGTPLARSFLLRLRDRKAWVDSDVARLVILWRYGGVFFDADMLLVRDVAPLLGLEFATEFSCDHVQGAFNNAVLRLVARSTAATALLERAKAIWPRVRSWAYGPTLLRDAAAAGAAVHRAPWCFFHGIWCAGALPPGALGGAAPWSPRLVANAFGLHLHRAGAGAAPVHNASVLAAAARANRAEVLARARAAGAATREELEAWRRMPLPGSATG